MNKDGQVKLGSTACDYCARPATQTRGRLVVCALHADMLDSNEKAASANQVPLKAAPIMFSNKHK